MELLGCSFNQDYECFSCGTSSGFCVFNSEPFQETVGHDEACALHRVFWFGFKHNALLCLQFRRDFEGRGIGIAVMLFRCNILALVGGGANPYFPSSKVSL